MTTLLHLDASAQDARSLSRRLSASFVEGWRTREPGVDVIRRDLSVAPPPHVTQDWVAAAFTSPDQRDAAMRAALAWSDRAIDEVIAADVIVMGAPMYNYGMPSALKAWFDQVIRIGRTFSFDLGRGDWPLEPILAGKRMVVLSARGEFGFRPGDLRDAWNHLDPHIATCAHYLGVAPADIETISIEYQEFKDARHQRSIDDAEQQVAALVARFAGFSVNPG